MRPELTHSEVYYIENWSWKDFDLNKYIFLWCVLSLFVAFDLFTVFGDDDMTLIFINNYKPTRICGYIACQVQCLLSSDCRLEWLFFRCHVSKGRLIFYRKIMLELSRISRSCVYFN